MILTLAIAITLWGSVGGLALAHDPRELLEPFRRRALFARAVVLDTLLVPLATWVIVRGLGMPDAFALGILLVGIASAGPLGIVATQLARGDARLALALVAFLEIANAVAIPLWTTVLLPSSIAVAVSDLVVVLVAYVFAPLGLGLLVRVRSRTLAVRLLPVARVARLGGLVFAIGYVLVTNWALLAPAAEGGVVAASLLIIGAALAGGWVLAGGSAATRKAVALVTAQRGSSLALAITVTTFSSVPEATTAVVAYGMISLIVVPSVAVLLGRRARAAGEPLPA